MIKQKHVKALKDPIKC